MTDISVKIEGLDKFHKRLKVNQDAIEKEVAAALFVSAKKIEGDAKKSILQGGKTGRTYQKYNPRRTHRASAPGQAPASDTGRLVNSIHSELIRRIPEAVIKAGGGVVKYARMLEYGTSKMAARPFFFPAVERNRRFITERVKKGIRKAIARANR